MAEFWSSRRPIQLWGERFEVVQGVSTPFFHTVEEEYPATCFGTIKQVADGRPRLRQENMPSRVLYQHQRGLVGGSHTFSKRLAIARSAWG